MMTATLRRRLGRQWAVAIGRERQFLVAAHCQAAADSREVLIQDRSWLCGTAPT